MIGEQKTEISYSGAMPAEETRTNLHVVKLGSGDLPPIVLLHGWGQSHAALLPLGLLLAESRPVHIVDLPGFGASEPPSATWGTVDYAECLHHYLKAENIHRCAIFGHSFGGKVALTFAHRYPSMLDRLVLLNSAGLPRRRDPRREGIRFLGKTVKGVDTLLGTSLFRSKFSARFGSTDYNRTQGIMRTILVRSVNEDITPIIPEIQTKTLLIWSEKDQETPLYMGRSYQKLLPNSRLLVLEGKEHSPYENAGHHLLATYMEPFLS